jgi:hypothetical protein
VHTFDTSLYVSNQIDRLEGEKTMAAKSTNRCWPGRKPVKGNKEHSQGSCQPKETSKLTGSEKNSEQSAVVSSPIGKRNA